MKSPGDYIWYGALVWMVGAIVAALVADSSAPLGLVLVAAGVPGLAGGVLVNIGAIAWGVRVGMRAAHDEGGRR